MLQSDAGVYTVIYDNGETKALIESEAFTLVVSDGAALPANVKWMVMRLGLALGACGVAATRSIA